MLDVRRPTTVRDGVKINTTSVVLSFGNPVLPPKVFLGYQAFTVREYIPAPKDATNAKSSVILLQLVEANNAAANVMEITNTEATLVIKRLW